MLIHSKQPASKIIVAITLSLTLAINIIAKEIPITQEAELIVPVGEFSVVEFPFKISSKNITSFMTEKKIIKEEENSKAINDDLLAKNEPLKEATAPASTPSPKKNKENELKDISIVQNINSFTFFPKKAGILKIVVWGYDTPILLTIKAEVKNGFGHYQFILPQSKSDLVAKTEQGSHEEVVNMIMTNLFNQTLPKGYKSSSKDAIFKSDGFEIRLNRELYGKKYIGQEWILKNEKNESSNIHEETFYEKGVYGVSLETNFIKNGESIRVFIVRAANSEAQ